LEHGVRQKVSANNYEFIVSEDKKKYIQRIEFRVSAQFVKIPNPRKKNKEKAME